MSRYRTKSDAAAIAALTEEVETLRSECASARAAATASLKLVGVLVGMLRRTDALGQADARDVTAVVKGTMRALK